MKQVLQVPEPAQRPRDAHKGSCGTLSILAGSKGMLGAAILAARGALRSGVGLVRCGLPAELMNPMAIAVPSATSFDREAPRVDLFARASAVLCGPGLATDRVAQELLQRVLDHCKLPLALDADALNLIAPLEGELPLAGEFVITPHPGEAGRLLGSSAKEVQADRLASVQQLAERSGGIAVLKGAATLVCDGERYYQNETGNPGLASGGTGDVLAGLLGSLLAQGMPAFDAACLAVQVHGRAGDLVAERSSEAGLIAEDLPQAIAEVLGK
ncbi:MAG: NAD(P)H-hydrate dehydratase [Planctomycetota bacterium]|jgi:NAD(P)H-hydrate epimerase